MGHQGYGAQFSSLSFFYSVGQRYALNPCARQLVESQIINEV